MGENSHTCDFMGFNMIYIMRFACTLMVIKWDSPYVSLT